jgi:hypothetical protein
LAIKIILEPLVLLVSRYSATDHGSSSGEAYILWYIPGKIPEALENFEAVKNSMTKKSQLTKLGAWYLPHVSSRFMTENVRRSIPQHQKPP